MLSERKTLLPMDNKAGNNFPLIRQNNVNEADDINDHPALLTYETNIPVNNTPATA